MLTFILLYSKLHYLKRCTFVSLLLFTCILTLITYSDTYCQIGIINTAMDGPEQVCQGGTGVYTARTAGNNWGCFESEVGAKWTIKRSNGANVFEFIPCPTGDKIQWIDLNYIELTNMTPGTNCGLPNTFQWLNGRTISIRWKVADTYTMEAKPAGTKVKVKINGVEVGVDATICQKTTKTVKVVEPNAAYTASIGDLSGNRYVTCTTSSSSFTYSVPAVPDAVRYSWRFSNATNNLSMSFAGNASINTTTPSATATVGTTSGYAQGTLTVTAFNACGYSVSRVFNLFRSSPPSSIAPSGSIGCAQCFTAPEGSNYTWSLPGTQTNVYFDGSSTSPTVCIRSRTSGSTVNGYLQVAYNGGCAGERLSTGISFTINPCSGRLSSERVVAESVSPNPANDIITISHPTGIYEVTLLDALGRRATHCRISDYEGTLDVKSLPAGIYILRLHNSDGLNSTHRVIITR